VSSTLAGEMFGVDPRAEHGATVFRLLALSALAAAFVATRPAVAAASQLIDRNASSVGLAVDARGPAILTYRAQGKLRRVLAWGAINALAPTRSRPQVAFDVDYSGGWGTSHWTGPTAKVEAWTDWVYESRFEPLRPPHLIAGAGCSWSRRSGGWTTASEDRPSGNRLEKSKAA
jgi:hypothetical protein